MALKREVKIWGERWLIRDDSTHAISYLKLDEGYRCSWHKHDTKYNLFVVLTGAIKIIIEELGKKKHIILTSGQELTIKPGQWHEFQALENSQVIEEMYVEYFEADIIRENKGSKL